MQIFQPLESGISESNFPLSHLPTTRSTCHSHWVRLSAEPPGLLVICQKFPMRPPRNLTAVQCLLGDNAHLITVLESIIKLLPAITFTLFSSCSKEKGKTTTHVRGNKQYINVEEMTLKVNKSQKIHTTCWRTEFRIWIYEIKQIVNLPPLSSLLCMIIKHLETLQHDLLLFNSWASCRRIKLSLNYAAFMNISQTPDIWAYAVSIIIYHALH